MRHMLQKSSWIWALIVIQSAICDMSMYGAIVGPTVVTTIFDQVPNYVPYIIFIHIKALHPIWSPH